MVNARDQGHRFLSALIGNSPLEYNIETDNLGIFKNNKIKIACQERLKQMSKGGKE